MARARGKRSTKGGGLVNSVLKPFARRKYIRYKKDENNISKLVKTCFAAAKKQFYVK